MSIPENILALIQKYQDGSATEEEQAILNEWYHSFDDNIAEVDNINREDADEISEYIKNRLQNTIHSNQLHEVKPLYKWQLPAAAAILLILALVLFISYYKKLSNSNINTNTASTIVHKVNDIAPGGNKALLTLADGTTIVLDSASNGTIGKQGNITIQKLSNGLLAYTINGKVVTENDAMFYNTISTPRGGKYQLILEDGTKVWLNAASSIRFPVKFGGGQRKVDITGEAYFEVAKNKDLPFRVNAASSQVEVLGTHFNINAYDDESFVKTTLLEGAVKVSVHLSDQHPEDAFLKPGQQSSIDNSGKLKIISNADTAEAVAWKNGRFQFTSADLKTILRQIARWYNVNVIYKGNADIHFTGQLSRTENVSKIFDQLALTGEVHFKIDGNNIIVTP
ncbi:MAG: FecR domain-containing protein [Bacteroidetes bacterium]|nr:FecR domain-containing protein [Bacteroidota bacterium]MBS1756071.1 FecR domain-containing protein [Bacteroidota bacterium]